MVPPNRSYVPVVNSLSGPAETTVITPRLVGKGVEMHPLFVMLALLLGVRFFGLGGLILALPAAAVIAGLLPILLPERPAAPATGNTRPSPG